MMKWAPETVSIFGERKEQQLGTISSFDDEMAKDSFLEESTCAYVRGRSVRVEEKGICICQKAAVKRQQFEPEMSHVGTGWN